jgi:hypothetical protein
MRRHRRCGHRHELDDSFGADADVDNRVAAGAACCPAATSLRIQWSGILRRRDAPAPPSVSSRHLQLQPHPPPRMPTRTTATTSNSAAARRPKIVVKNSRIHGRGVYAGRKLKKGERVVEYKGELITWKECDRRPPSDPDDPHHTFFFSLSDGKHVIDAAVGGNAAKWINHSCAPNCETEEDDEGQRVFIVALRDIRAGEELNYDYGLITDERITPTLKKNYECRCGARNCRGTMLALKSRSRSKRKG